MAIYKQTINLKAVNVAGLFNSDPTMLLIQIIQIIMEDQKIRKSFQ